MNRKPTARRNRRSALRHRYAKHTENNSKAELTVRPCMCCGKLFKSEWKFNRLCQPCKDGVSSAIA